MFNTLITHLQIFGIGFTFGIIGPCLLICTPAVITYIAGTKRRWHDVLTDTLIFLSGRMLAYIALGYLAGLSANFFAQFTNAGLTKFFRPLGGVFSIALGILVLLYKESGLDHCKAGHIAATPACASGAAAGLANFGGLLGLGFLMGVTPCAPLVALLFEIGLISHNGIEGALYAFSFGLGTFLSSLIVIGALAGLLAWLPAGVLKSKTGKRAFKIVCALFLILLGLSLIL